MTGDVCFETCDCCETLINIKKENEKLERQVIMLSALLDKQGLPVTYTCTVSTSTENDVGILSQPERAVPNSPLPLSSLNSSHSDTISSTSSENSITKFSSEQHELVEPFAIHPGKSFRHFSFDDLHLDTSYGTGLKNRLVSYYGEQSYQYSNIVHTAQPFTNNKTLVKILDHVREIFPQARFNSAMVTFYKDGGKHIPYHSDNEEEISEDSDIITISFGQTRAIKFKSIKNGSKEISLNLSHGDVFTMTKSSQYHYQHSVPRDYSTQPRVSVTLRQMIPVVDRDIVKFLQELGSPVRPSGSTSRESPTPNPNDPPGRESSTPNRTVPRGKEKSFSNPGYQHNHLTPHATNKNPSKSITVYLSSSMFRKLDPRKLSSKSQDAEVFFYPSATAGKMLEQFRNDPRLYSLDSQRIGRFIIMTGTNNVDRILFDNPQAELNRSETDTYNLMNFVHEFAPGAIIDFVNLLPRYNAERNTIVNKLNNFLYFLSNECTFVNYINTGHERFLFSTPEGFRKCLYFVEGTKSNPDNPHLNILGIERLGKHLKYVAHNC